MTPEKQTLPKSTERRSLAWKVAPDLFASFRYAWQGIVYATRTQRNFRIHLGIAIFVWAMCFFLSLSFLETAVLTAMVALVLVLELINTALESVVDLTVQQTYHELAKIAKDCAAAAVLVGAIASLAVAVLISFPHFRTMLTS
ncbi:diacylglycerol kinase family protein [[Limnothrix rosea] IAM M-220]|uniref:diacylglycerol kinase family protein n=1 Tax=[Limnothrix rosea] IAM M-220 TaxID=454133 RepID=UPI00096945C7|nr:diacylglycerol kinase family protein [[Limnothrix rosea] IAM M-220]OKH17752.1 diacylglycerol kinase [[Limnothrix rosea] IAM M-220]